MTFAGAVLAGGRSSRMGRNKALLRLAGEPLWRHQQRVLKEAGANPIWIVQAPGQRALTRSVIRDTVRDAGPLAGLHASLVHCDHGHVAVLAVDLPFIDQAWWVRLAKLCSPGIGVVARTRAGYEPLAAIYPCEGRAEAAMRLAKGEFALQKFVTALVRSRRLRVLHLQSADRWHLANWNMPCDVS